MKHSQAVDTFASERYLLGEMSELERYAFEEHFFSCRECADDVRAGEMMRQRVRSALAAGDAAAQTVPPAAPAPVPLRRASWRPQVVLPWACAATVTVLFGYESLLVVPELRRVGTPQALAPVTLHPATRGADTIVAVNPDRPFAVLAVDVNSPSTAGAIAYEVTTDTGSPVLSGTTEPPAAGTPLLLLIPVRQLAVGAHYRLVVRDQTASSSTLGEYRFGVAAGR